MPKLKQWSIVDYYANGIITPENRVRCCAGFVYEHPTRQDGEPIRTSQIVDVHERVVVTRTGTIYILEGPPNYRYMRFLEEHSIPYNHNNPIHFVRNSHIVNK